MNFRQSIPAALVAAVLAQGAVPALAQSPAGNPAATASTATSQRQPQRLFSSAMEAYIKRDYHSAAADVREAAASVRHDAAAAAGDVKKELDAASHELEQAAAALDQSAVRARRDLERTFARADHALALAHRSRAAQAWARKAYDQAGQELKAAADDLDDAATWAGARAHATASSASADARAVGDKLANGGAWAEQEVARGFQGLGSGLDKLGRAIGLHGRAPPWT